PLLSIAAGNSTVRGLVLTRTPGSALSLLNNGGNRIVGNIIGADVSGTLARPNGTGILVSAPSSNNIIGGASAADPTLISRNDTYGVWIESTGNQVLGNYIGIDSSGTVSLGNALGGVYLVGESNTVGGTGPGEGNVVSGNGGDGILLARGRDNRVLGNYIG